MSKTLKGLILLIFFPLLSQAQQQTVGLFTLEPGATPGYTLFSPMTARTTYLIDNCGREINSWNHTLNPGLSCYLLENGDLLRTGRQTSGNFYGGGIGGVIEKYDWDGNLLWKYTYADSLKHQHHDIEPLPNGNILVLAWEYRSAAEAIAAGRDPGSLGASIWPTQIVEITPIGTDSMEIVWEWHLFDHLIQDFDSSKTNFGVVTDHPELVNFNYLPSGSPLPAQSDWIHANAVDYNPQLDQIAISSRNLGEVWIIDHSTSTTEAAGHSGGNSGMGGDLLWRWGNPNAYKRGTAGQKQLYGQHDIRWIEDSLTWGGRLMVFNNGQGRPGPQMSSVEILVPPINSQNTYDISPGQPFGPAAPIWKYEAQVPTTFYSSSISGAHALPNGHVLICEGNDGRLFEVDSNKIIQWDYIVPVNVSGPIAQGNTPVSNNVFRCHRYDTAYPAFTGRNLTPGTQIELNPLPLPANCGSVSRDLESTSKGISIFPNPIGHRFFLQNTSSSPKSISIHDARGKEIFRGEAFPGKNTIESDRWSAGIYFLKVQGVSQSIKLVKLRVL